MDIDIWFCNKFWTYFVVAQKTAYLTVWLKKKVYISYEDCSLKC